MTHLDLSIQAQVDAQLMEQGAYTALELLLNTGRLIYGDYESWRRGEIEFLDDVLMGAKQKIQAQIEHAAEYARSIGLIEQTQEFHRWARAPSDVEAKPLRISADVHLHRLAAARYVPAQTAPQLDLFFDNPVVALTNGVVRALSSRNLSEAQRMLDRLYAQAPNHADLGAFDRLTAALERLNGPVPDTREGLKFLLEVAPTARRLLESQGRDLLAPLWRQLADALRGQPYSNNEPELHRSFALMQAQDWSGVTECILAEPNWTRFAPLCLRLAHSSFYQRQRILALTAWCHLCWLDPAQAARTLDSRQPDVGIARAWARFQDSENGGPLFEEHHTPNACDFPAWMLLQEQGLAHQLPLELPKEDGSGEEHYRQVHRWIQARRAGRHDEEIALRRALRASSPFLFNCLKGIA